MTNDKSLRLMLLRHGNTFNDNEICYQVGLKTDLPLTEKGLLQATRFSEYLKLSSETPFAIYSGALQRQSKTAEIVHHAFPDATLHTNETAFNELDYGPWEGLTPERIQAQWPTEYQAWHEKATWPEGIFNQSLESHLAALKRWLTDLYQSAPNNALIVAVSSQGLIRLMLHFVNNDHLDNYKVGTGCYCVLNLIAPEHLTIQAWNQKP